MARDYQKYHDWYYKYYRQWALDNPEKRRAAINKYNQKPEVKLAKRQWHEIKTFGQLVTRGFCELCGDKPERLRDLVVHHVDGNNGKMGHSLNNDISNLVVLCRKCHPTIHNRWGIKELTEWVV